MIISPIFQSKLQLWRLLLFLSLTVWATIASVVALNAKPTLILVGIDQYGTRLISSETDRLLLIEKQNFLKKYLHFLFNYNSANYDTRTSSAGDMMSEALWELKKTELERISNQLKNTELTQTATITELRELPDNIYEADIHIELQTKLEKKTTKLRTILKLRPSTRTQNQPYPYEVIEDEEHLLP
jgi:hypothetical protein